MLFSISLKFRIQHDWATGNFLPCEPILEPHVQNAPELHPTLNEWEYTDIKLQNIETKLCLVS